MRHTKIVTTAIAVGFILTLTPMASAEVAPQPQLDDGSRSAEHATSSDAEVWTNQPAVNKVTGYEVTTDRGTIHLRHGMINGQRYTWAAVKNPTDTSQNIRLEVDYTGNREYDDYRNHDTGVQRWTNKRLEDGTPKHMRACVIDDPKLGCNPAHSTSWWPVGS